MQQLILLFHVIISIAMVGLILVQQGKGSDVGAAFGSGSSNTMFGSQGATPFLFKLTATLAALFFACCLVLSNMAAGERQFQSSVSSLPAKSAPSSTTSGQTSLPLVSDDATSDKTDKSK